MGPLAGLQRYFEDHRKGYEHVILVTEAAWGALEEVRKKNRGIGDGLVRPAPGDG